MTVVQSRPLTETTRKKLLVCTCVIYLIIWVGLFLLRVCRETAKLIIHTEDEHSPLS